ncbi:nucleoside ABC transporter membrane protein [Halanaerobium saccharolyticum]|uniref:Nucleoside ABC transporter membrane protein n=1 Tax=Halanaerobium saccharolyticum TaxID=43595 RepID=A0A4R6M1G6_9FIRM|nr:ABC transporter permease [Halanaerobium saccharolyticum]TDO95068.1 nucleoside ABC transporter membrane protein [Halanaerobium saccharolyticum]
MNVLGTIFSINTLAAAIRLVVPIALAAVGGAFSERSGVINIGLEGMILTGAFAGAVGSYYSGSAFFGVLAALAAGAILGLLFSFFTIDLEADHVVAGVGINILSLGFTTWLMQVIWGQKGASPQVAGLPEIKIPILADLPLLGDLLASNSPIVYLMFIIVISSWYLLFKTPLGLRIRFTGEHPEAADTLGINIRFIKYFSVTLSGVLAALGGSYLSLGHLNWFSSNMSAGRGYMALAANIFGQWNPLGGFAASMLFAFTDAVQMRLQGMNLNIASEFIQMLPYVLTVLILAGAVIRSRPPAALGSHYKSNK